MVDHKNGLLVVAGAILLGFGILAGVLFFPLKNHGNQIAIVNMSQVLDESQLGKQIKKELESKRQELQAKRQLATTDAEKSRITYEFEKYKNDKLQPFFEKIKKITTEVAKEKGITSVSRPEMYIYCQNDLTETVIKRIDQ
jgi:Skp family chaperone for outer membrane proteins